VYPWDAKVPSKIPELTGESHLRGRYGGNSTLRSWQQEIIIKCMVKKEAFTVLEG